VTRFIAATDNGGRIQEIHFLNDAERQAGRYVCFAVVPDGYDTAVGIFQVRQLDPMFGTGGGASRSVPHSGVLVSSSAVRSWF
jgi:hypothetical protein